MNDNFLQSFRAAPRQAFVDGLRSHLNLQAKQAAVRHVAFRNLSLAFIAIMMAFALLLVVSPTVRAKVQTVVRQVGGVAFNESGEYPGEGGLAETIETEMLSLKADRGRLPFQVSLPTWMPEGYALPDTAYLIRFPGMNNLELRATRFSLTIRDRHPGESDWQEVIGLNSLEEITVNGQPAALAHGGWNADIKAWDEAIDVWSLFWAHGEQVYILKTYGQSISVEDMIRIAESIP